jgi:phage terminase small subunit
LIKYRLTSDEKPKERMDKQSQNKVIDAVKMDNLNAREEKFCHFYAITGNGTKSCISAGYSKKAAGTIAYHMLRKPKIDKRVREILEIEKDRQTITRKQIIEEYGKLAFTNLSDVVSLEDLKTLRIRDLADLPADAVAAISEIKQSNTGGITIKMHNKLGALDSLSRIYELFGDPRHKPEGGTINKHQFVDANGQPMDGSIEVKFVPVRKRDSKVIAEDAEIIGKD